MDKFNIGIDLGTTNIVCTTMNKGKFETLKINRKEIMPSVLLFKDGEVTTGIKAKKKSVINSKNYIKSSKTYMGNKKKSWKIEEKKFNPTDVATELLSSVHQAAKDYFNTEEPINAVITVPAYFNSKQRGETKKAAERAGLKVESIITEPMAAALAYGFEEDKDQTLFVIDLGGGTFDVSILRMEGENYNTLAIEGDKKLGGDDFDKVILSIFKKEIRKTNGIDLSSLKKSELDSDDYHKAIQKLVEEAEVAKIALSEETSTEIIVSNLLTKNDELINFSMTLTREEFEKESSDLLFKISKTIKKCLDDCDFESKDIDKVILVGGSTNIPAVREIVVKELNKEPYANKDLAKLVSMGAALKANAEEVAIKIKDIVAHSLGLRVRGGEFSPIIPKNTEYPVEITKKYTTTFDLQEVVDIKIYEGEDKFVENNESFGGFELAGIEKAEAGVPKIDVTFKFDESQILHVTAIDLNTNTSASKKINVVLKEEIE